MVMPGIRAKASSTRSRPLCTKPVAADPEEAARAPRRSPCPVRQGVGDRRRVRHLEHRLAGEGVGRRSRSRCRAASRSRRPRSPWLLPTNLWLRAPMPRRSRSATLAGEHRGVAGEPVRGVEVRDLDAAGVERRARSGRGSAARDDQQVVAAGAAGSGVRSRLDDVDREAEPAPGPGHRETLASRRGLGVPRSAPCRRPSERHRAPQGKRVTPIRWRSPGGRAVGARRRPEPRWSARGGGRRRYRQPRRDAGQALPVHLPPGSSRRRLS